MIEKSTTPLKFIRDAKLNFKESLNFIFFNCIHNVNLGIKNQYCKDISKTVDFTITLCFGGLVRFEIPDAWKMCAYDAWLNENQMEALAYHETQWGDGYHTYQSTQTEVIFTEYGVPYKIDRNQFREVVEKLKEIEYSESDNINPLWVLDKCGYKDIKAFL